MKKPLALGVLGWVALTSSSFAADGYIRLDNYNSADIGGPPITYGFNVPANGVGGTLGTPGSGLLSGWTVGIYFVVGTPSISDPAGDGIPNVQLTLGTGPGSTVSMYNSAFNTPGEFFSSSGFDCGGNAGDTITAEIVVYNSAASSYATATFRAHSAPFTMPTIVGSNPLFPRVGDYMPGFSVSVPEPATMTLAGFGGLSLLLFLRKKA